MHKVNGAHGCNAALVGERALMSDIATRLGGDTHATSADYDTADCESHENMSHNQTDGDDELPQLSRNSSRTARLSVSFGHVGQHLAEDSSDVAGLQQDLQEELDVVRCALKEEIQLSQWYSSQLEVANRQVGLLKSPLATRSTI